MSGHSHYATIKREKEANDAARGKTFSKLAKEIAIAVKTGGGGDPDSNFKLRMVMDKAREVNMPKDNVERAIAHATSTAEAIEEVSYEGFGPSGVAVMVVAATDNRNRTAQEIKNIFDRAGGRLGGPGSVSFNFENKGFLLVEKDADPESQMLKLIDLGVEDVNETPDGIEVYVQPDKLSQTKKSLEETGFKVTSAEISMEAKSYQTISDPKEASKVMSFLDLLNDHDDVQQVYSNADIVNV
ncbi:YebC/PmpR family DNA-binding transcriptional regulator [Patescibacteria group bacterium]|nr:YebC/PmpR family DNA-binding transcriptional regulator [Patescibacteria group bacterium]